MSSPSVPRRTPAARVTGDELASIAAGCFVGTHLAPAGAGQSGIGFPGAPSIYVVRASRGTQDSSSICECGRFIDIPRDPRGDASRRRPATSNTNLTSTRTT